MTKIKTILFTLFLLTFLSGAGGTAQLNLGGGEFLVGVSEKLPIEKEKLESIWLRSAYQACGSDKFDYVLDDARIDRSQEFLIDGEADKVKPTRVLLAGAVKCL
ncbi:MAG: hypothetical protein ACRBHB_24330 [Arenicella sp.]